MSSGVHRATALLAAGTVLAGCGSSRATGTPTTVTGVTAQPPAVAQPTSGALSTNPVAVGRRLRKTYEAELNARILADARLLVSAHLLRGPVLGVSCTPMERGGHPIVASTIHFNCIVINHRVEDPRCPCRGTVEGIRFFGAIDLATGVVSYHGH